MKERRHKAIVGGSTVSREKKENAGGGSIPCVLSYEWMRSVRQKNGTLLTFANPSFQSKVEPDLGVFEVEGGAALSKEIYYAH